MIIIIFAFDSLQPMFFHNAIGEFGYGITHAIFMVSLGYWIKKTNFTLSRIKAFLICVAAIGICAGINLCWLLIFGDRNRIITDYNSPFIIIASCMVFMFFLLIKHEKIGIFSKIAPYLFAVYLINDHPCMRAIVYDKIFHCSKFYYSHWFVLHYFGFCIIFIVIGISLDFLYSSVIRKLKPHKHK